MYAPSILLALTLSVTAGFGIAKAAMKPLPETAGHLPSAADAESCLGYIALATRLGEEADARELLESECGTKPAPR